MTSAHFICKSGKGITPEKKGTTTYFCRAWDIPFADAERLVGGHIYFHETKSSPSYFGGKVLSFETVEIDKAHSKRICFKIEAALQCKGANWKGRDDDLAWYSGVVS